MGKRPIHDKVFNSVLVEQLEQLFEVVGNLHNIHV